MARRPEAASAEGALDGVVRAGAARADGPAGPCLGGAGLGVDDALGQGGEGAGGVGRQSGHGVCVWEYTPKHKA